MDTLNIYAAALILLLTPYILIKLRLLYIFLVGWSTSDPCKNPLIKDTSVDRYYEGVCRRYGCITTESYYGMAQASCARCGGRNSCAGDSVGRWRTPDRLLTSGRGKE
tara:strand:+ start:832 stop:1155 length:324 start_codon:yes stop_codon:yes gene_type:complete